MDSTAGLQRSLTVAHGIPSPFDDTGCRSRDNTDRLVKIVDVRRQASPRLEQPIPADHFNPWHQRFVEAVNEFGVRSGGSSFGGGKPIDSFSTGEPRRRIRHRSSREKLVNQCSAGGIGCHRNVEYCGFGGRGIAGRVRQPGGDHGVIEFFYVVRTSLDFDCHRAAQ